jgi:hypothetical protein
MPPDPATLSAAVQARAVVLQLDQLAPIDAELKQVTDRILEMIGGLSG